ncbi:MAG: hypothetical protein WD225_02880 [Ilumatobacteraceae bacterium]
MSAGAGTDTTATGSQRRTHGVLGGIAGFLFGVFVWLDLVLFGVAPLDSVLVYVLPLLGLVAGIALGKLTPFRRGGRDGRRAAPSGTEPTR